MSLITRWAVTLSLGCLVLAGAGFVISALFIWLSTMFAVYQAALILGAALIVLPLLAMLAMRVRRARRTGVASFIGRLGASFVGVPPGASFVDLLLSSGADRLGEGVRRHPLKTAALLFGLGLASGALADHPRTAPPGRG